MLTINVIQEDIDKGETLSRENNPIARALKRMGYKNMFFVCSTFLFCLDGSKDRIKLPEIAEQFCYDFNNGKLDLCKPFTFSVDYTPRISESSNQ